MEGALSCACSIGYNPPPMLKLNTEEIININTELAVLEQILRPSHEKGCELTGTIMKFLSTYPFGLRHDGSLIQAKVDTWCDELEHLPLYAIKRAIKWKLQGKEKEPSLAKFIKSVKLAVGRKVLERKKLLEKLAYSS